MDKNKMPFPAPFISSVGPLLGDDAERFFNALSADAPVSIRLNPERLRRNPMSFSESAERVPWSEWGFYLAERPSFTFDPLFHAGYYYVQEASSMFVEHVVRKLVKQPAVCLDACASPGGKSVSLLSALPEGSLLVSNEIIRQRANVLAETMTKFGNPDCVVTNNAPKDFAALPRFFDVVLVDAPCSGEGMFRKDDAAVQEWSPENVAMCAARQKDILRDVWPSLKPDGLLIYSTCTYNTAENEENVRWIMRELGAECVCLETEAEWGISPSVDDAVAAYRFFPHKTRGEGLFVTVLRKTDDASAQSAARKNKKKSVPLLKDAADFAPLLRNPQLFDFLEDDGRIIALPKHCAETMLLLRHSLKTIALGIEIGTRKGRDFIPSHALAMSAQLHAEAFHCCEVSYEQAVAYLRKETVLLPDAPKGFVLLTFCGEPVGFAKNIGNRANNLYPQEWRIRSGYLPEKRIGWLQPTNASAGSKPTDA